MLYRIRDIAFLVRLASPHTDRSIIETVSVSVSSTHEREDLRKRRLHGLHVRPTYTDGAALLPPYLEKLSISSMTRRQGGSEGVAGAPLSLGLIPLNKLMSSRIMTAPHPVGAWAQQ